jgi:hypothetical protein
MKFYKIQMLGRFLSEYVANVTALSYSASLDKGRILYDETTNTLYFGDNSGGGQFTQIGGSIPSTEIILFEKNTAVSGYTLLTNIDDETVYITKGSLAGGATGGAQKGAWTITGLAADAHTHTGASHNHTIPRDGWGESGTTAGRLSVGRTDGLYSITAANDQSTGSTASGASSYASATGITHTPGWRPLGRNYTRQQKI